MLSSDWQQSAGPNEGAAIFERLCMANHVLQTIWLETRDKISL